MVGATAAVEAQVATEALAAVLVGTLERAATATLTLPGRTVLEAAEAAEDLRLAKQIIPASAR
jgi:hypothetical protein